MTMLRAAVPQSVAGQDTSDCPPGHRFGLYDASWAEGWRRPGKKADAGPGTTDRQGPTKAELEQERIDELKARQAACSMPRNATELLRAVVGRQGRIADRLAGRAHAHILTIEAEATSPLATGLGLDHPSDNGFAFLSPYGLPYLAGSGVKGVMRRAAKGLTASRAEGIDDRTVDALFGPERIDRPEDARRGALICWDVLPRFDTAMALEIMTPHQHAYLQDEESPHDAGQPNPIVFLAVPAGARLSFTFVFEPAFVASTLRERLQAEWREIVARIAAHAFEWLGFGAKTAVGYGAVQESKESKQAREAVQVAYAQAQAAAQAAQRRQSMSPEEAEFDEVQPRLKDFAAKLDALRPGDYKPGSTLGNAFDKVRQALLEDALGWRHPQARVAAGRVLRDSYSRHTGWPNNKDRKAEIRRKLAQLDGQA